MLFAPGSLAGTTVSLARRGNRIRVRCGYTATRIGLPTGWRCTQLHGYASCGSAGTSKPTVRRGAPATCDGRATSAAGARCRARLEAGHTRAVAWGGGETPDPWLKRRWHRPDQTSTTRTSQAIVTSRQPASRKYVPSDIPLPETWAQRVHQQAGPAKVGKPLSLH